MFKDTVVIITGGSSGLGKALARRFVKQGAHVALVARDAAKLALIRDGLSAGVLPGQKIGIFPCDVADHAACEQTVRGIAETLGTPQVLINSAGILKEGYFDSLPLAAFRNVMEVNYFGIVHFIRAVLPYFRRNGGGRIVNIASLGGKIGSFGYTPYCSSKFALVGLTETLRCELKPRNIVVQLACPGEFESPMTSELDTYRTSENRAVTQTVPVMSLERVADGIFAGILQDRYLIIPGHAARFMERINRWFPGMVRAIVDAKLKADYVGPKL